MQDHGKQPYVVNIEELTVANTDYRQAVWTGEHLQMTLMSIEVGGEIGLEVHPDNDQFLRIEQGSAKVQMGSAKDKLDFEADASAESGIFVPAGTWHNVTNTGDVALKVYSIYSPVHHPAGIVQATFAEAQAAE